MGQEQSHDNNISVSTKTSKTPSKPDKQKASLGDIIVVSNKKHEVENIHDDDDDLINIKKLKITQPIMQNNLVETEHVKLPRIQAGPFTEMLLRYQVHLTECAEAIAVDQTILTKRIKEIDGLSASVNKKIIERQKSFDHAISQFSMINDIMTVVAKMDAKLKTTLVLFDKINKQLPKEHQIPDESLKSLY